MSDIRVDLESVQVVEGQGAGEGDFELRVQVQEGTHQVVWPGLNSSAKVDKKGAPYTINRQVATYTVDSGTLSKRFNVDLTEVDKGTLGQDDVGQGTITFDLKPGMSPASKSATIDLKRPNMKFLGKVKVTMSAQVA
jgi:hypothetical protein